jgi:hypothetical protein
LRGFEFDAGVLRRALEETVKSRSSQNVLTQYQEIINSIKVNQQMQGFWEKYRKEFNYAKDISFEDTCDTVLLIMKSIAWGYKDE